MKICVRHAYEGFGPMHCVAICDEHGLVGHIVVHVVYS